eukprot:NODE_741_length_4304_cov_0.498216.p2 type:complete len:267 gc:universal NODE_741_length_4304_cov_0.498216:1840-1040(-)
MKEIASWFSAKPKGLVKNSSDKILVLLLMRITGTAIESDLVNSDLRNATSESLDFLKLALEYCVSNHLPNSLYNVHSVIRYITLQTTDEFKQLGCSNLDKISLKKILSGVHLNKEIFMRVKGYPSCDLKFQTVDNEVEIAIKVINIKDYMLRKDIARFTTRLICFQDNKILLHQECGANDLNHLKETFKVLPDLPVNIMLLFDNVLGLDCMEFYSPPKRVNIALDSKHDTEEHHGVTVGLRDSLDCLHLSRIKFLNWVSKFAVVEE